MLICKYALHMSRQFNFRSFLDFAFRRLCLLYATVLIGHITDLARLFVLSVNSCKYAKYFPDSYDSI